LQNRVKHTGVVDAACTRVFEIGARERPGMLGDGSRQSGERANSRFRMAVRQRARIADELARQRVIRTCGTQKLCVSRRSIEALIESRCERRDELALGPRQRSGLIHAAREPEDVRHQIGVQTVREDDARHAAM